MRIDFDGPPVDSPDPSTYTSGSRFGISLYDADNNPPSHLRSGRLLATLNLDPDCTVSTQTFPNTGDGPSAVTLTDLKPARLRLRLLSLNPPPLLSSLRVWPLTRLLAFTPQPLTPDA